MRIKAIVRLVLAIGLFILALMWTNAFTIVLGAAGIVLAWWENNNFTVEAITAQKLLNELKEGRKKVTPDAEEPIDSEEK